MAGLIGNKAIIKPPSEKGGRVARTSGDNGTSLVTLAYVKLMFLKLIIFLWLRCTFVSPDGRPNSACKATLIVIEKRNP